MKYEINRDEATVLGSEYNYYCRQSLLLDIVVSAGNYPLTNMKHTFASDIVESPESCIPPPPHVLVAQAASVRCLQQ